MPEIERLRGEFESALLSLNTVRAREIAAQAGANLSPLRLIDEVVSPVLQRMGEGWEFGRVSLAQVYLAGRLSEELVDAILPAVQAERRQQPRIAIAVLEDHHQLGKRVVYSMLRAGGFELKDYGHGLKVAELVSRTVQDGIELLLVSTLMLRAALMVRELKPALAARMPETKLVVGGAPFRLDPKLWQDVGADAVGRNASDALEIVSGFSGGGR